MHVAGSLVSDGSRLVIQRLVRALLVTLQRGRVVPTVQAGRVDARVEGSAPTPAAAAPAMIPAVPAIGSRAIPA